MGIADVIAHAMNCRFLLFLPHQQVEELEATEMEAILVDVQADLAVQEVPEEVQKVHQEEYQGHQ